MMEQPTRFFHQLLLPQGSRLTAYQLPKLPVMEHGHVLKCNILLLFDVRGGEETELIVRRCTLQYCITCFLVDSIISYKNEMGMYLVVLKELNIVSI
jgi:hypothetical protein